MVELSTIWNDKNISQKLKLKLVICLLWTVITYGAEGCTLRQGDVNKIEGAEMWLYRRLLRIKWDDFRTNESILNELQVNRELVSIVMKRKLSFFGHTIRKKHINERHPTRFPRKQQKTGATKNQLPLKH